MFQHGGPTEADVACAETFCNDFCETGLANVGRVEKRPKIDKNLYEVEIVDVNKERKQMKIHLAGFSEEFDEWRDYDCEGDYSNK